MKDGGLAAWVDEWAARYSGSNRALFEELRGRTSINADELVRVASWKNKRLWSGEKVRRIEDFEQRQPGRIGDITRHAFATDDAELALHALTVIPGLAARTASAVLTVRDPDLYTIMDRNALTALRRESLLGRQSDIERATKHLPRGDGWWRALFPDWLRICRDLAERSGQSLRRIDEALMARGQAMGR